MILFINFPLQNGLRLQKHFLRFFLFKAGINSVMSRCYQTQLPLIIFLVLVQLFRMKLLIDSPKQNRQKRDKNFLLIFIWNFVTNFIREQILWNIISTLFIFDTTKADWSKTTHNFYEFLFGTCNQVSSNETNEGSSIFDTVIPYYIVYKFSKAERFIWNFTISGKILILCLCTFL